MNAREQDRRLFRLGNSFRPTREAAMQEAERLPPEELLHLLERAQRGQGSRRRKLIGAGLAVALTAAPLLFLVDSAAEGPVGPASFLWKYASLLLILYFSGLGNSIVSYNADYWPRLILTLRGLLAATNDPRFLGEVLSAFDPSPHGRIAYDPADPMQMPDTVLSRARVGLCGMLNAMSEAQYAALTRPQKALLYTFLDAPIELAELAHVVLQTVARWKDVEALPAVMRLAGRSNVNEIVWNVPELLPRTGGDTEAGDPEEALLEAARQCRESLQTAVTERAQQASLLRASDSTVATPVEQLLHPAQPQANLTPPETLLRPVSPLNEGSGQSPARHVGPYPAEAAPQVIVGSASDRTE